MTMGMFNKTKPDTKRYIKEHGTGVTEAGIRRAMKLLPAMRAIGYPGQDGQVTEQDVLDTAACLRAYQKNGRLTPAGMAGMMWSDMGVFDDTDRGAVERLQSQDLPNGGTKYRFAFQSVPLAMEPSRDLMAAGWWHMLSAMCGSRNMEEFTDQDAAGAYLEAVSMQDAGAGTCGMAEKLADAWKGLDEAVPCGLEGGEGSTRMMQFCALQAAAYLDGYDFIPDEDHAKAIGQLVSDGFADMEAFKIAIGESLAEHGQPQAGREAPPAPQAESNKKPSALDRMRGLLSGQDGDDDMDGPAGPEL